MDKITKMKKLFSNLPLIFITFLVFGSANATTDFCSVTGGHQGFESNGGTLNFTESHAYCESVVRIGDVTGDYSYERCMCSFTPFTEKEGESECEEFTVSWGGMCGADVPKGQSGDTIDLTNERSGRIEGSAQYSCVNGVWRYQDGNCLEVPDRCEEGSEVSWPVTSPEWASTAGSNEYRYEPKPNCVAVIEDGINTPSGGFYQGGEGIIQMTGVDPELSDWQDKYNASGSYAQAYCLNGEWNITDQYECEYIPQTCQETTYTTTKGCEFTLEETEHNELFVSSDPKNPFNSKGEVRAFCWDGNWEIRTEHCELSCENSFPAYSWDSTPQTSRACGHTSKSPADFGGTTRTEPNGVITLENEETGLMGAVRLKCSDGEWDSESEYCKPLDCTSGIAPNTWSKDGNNCGHGTFSGTIPHGGTVQLPSIASESIGSKYYACEFGQIQQNTNNDVCVGLGEKLCFADQGKTFDEPYFDVPAWNGVEARCRYVDNGTDEPYTHCVTDSLSTANTCSEPMGENNTRHAKLTTQSCDMRVADTSTSFSYQNIGKTLEVSVCSAGNWIEDSEICVVDYSNNPIVEMPSRPADPDILDNAECVAETYSFPWRAESGVQYNFNFDLPDTNNSEKINVYAETDANAGDMRCDTGYVSLGEARCIGDNWSVSTSQYCKGDLEQPERWRTDIGCLEEFTTSGGNTEAIIDISGTNICNRNYEVEAGEDNVIENAFVYPLIDDKPFDQWSITNCPSDSCNWDYEVVQFEEDTCHICGKNGSQNIGDCGAASEYPDRIEVRAKNDGEYYNQYCDAIFEISFTDGSRTEVVNARAIAYSESPCLDDSCDEASVVPASCGTNNGNTLDTLTESSGNLCISGNVINFDGSGTNKFAWDCETSSGNKTLCAAHKTTECGSADGGTFGNLDINSNNLCAIGDTLSFDGQTTGEYKWVCENGDSRTSCSAIKSSACGSASGTTRSSEPTSGSRCEIGVASDVEQKQDRFIWSCDSGSTSNECFAYRTANCGSANNGEYNNLSITTDRDILCDSGNPDDSTFSASGNQFTWECASGFNSRVACSADRTASCGTAIETSHVFSPSSNLCAFGQTSVVEMNGQNFEWSCTTGANEVACSAPVSGKCGSSNLGTFENLAASDSELCEFGDRQSFNLTENEYTWECNNQGYVEQCSANKFSECGVANNETFAALDNSNSDLCELGAVKDFDDSSNMYYQWTCLSGTHNSYCRAYKDSSCGSAQETNQNSLSSNSSSLCESGNINNFNPNGRDIFEWNCANGSNNPACFAYKNPECGNANENTYHNLDQDNDLLCGIGNFKGFANENGLFEWTCSNGDVSNDVSCKAYEEVSCGSVANKSHSTLNNTASDLCGLGDVNNFNHTGTTYTWNCENGSSKKSCLAYEEPACDNSTIGACDIGERSRFISSLADTTSQWHCVNAAGLETNACQAEKAAPLDNGSCGTTINTCNSGTMNNVADDGYFYKWECGQNISGDNFTKESKKDSCSIPKGSCGTAHNQLFSTLSAGSSNLCGQGDVVNFNVNSSDNTLYEWGCKNISETANCFAYRRSACGANNEDTFASLSSTNSQNCSYGSVSDFRKVGTSFRWDCESNDSRHNVSCIAYENPECGSASGGRFETLDSNDGDLCERGSVIEFEEEMSTYKWQCLNQNGENSGQCVAFIDREPTCGSLNGAVTNSITENTSGLCAEGYSASFVSDDNGYSWHCKTSTEQTENRCEAYKTAKCGSPDNTIVESLSEDGSLCNVGDSEGFADNGATYTWSCNNQNKSTESCSATKVGYCGVSENITSVNFPTDSTLCETGLPLNKDTADRNLFEWDCRVAGSTGDASCSSFKYPTCGENKGKVRSSMGSTTAGNCGIGFVKSNSFDTNRDTWTWTCENGSEEDSSCFTYRSAKCGSSHNGTFSTLPSSQDQLCEIGDLSGSINPLTDEWEWTCSNGSGSNTSTINCSAYRSPECGSNENKFFDTLGRTNSNNCARGSVVAGDFGDTPRDFQWKCSNGSEKTNTCVAYKNPVCNATAVDKDYGNLDETNTLCDVGTITNWNNASGEDTTYTWKCENNGKISAQTCEAYKKPLCNNAVTGGTFSSLSQSQLCTTGIPIGFSNNGSQGTEFTWKCENDNGTQTPTCSAYRVAQCGTANNQTIDGISSSTSTLCNRSGDLVSGSFGVVSGSNNTRYSWSCRTTTSHSSGTVSCTGYDNASCDNSTYGGCSDGYFNGYEGTPSSGDNTEWRCRNADGVVDSSTCSRRKQNPTDDGTDDCGATVNQCLNGASFTNRSGQNNWYCGSNIAQTFERLESKRVACQVDIPQCNSNVTNKTHAGVGSASACSIGNPVGFSYDSSTATYSWTCENAGLSTGVCKAYKTPTCNNSQFRGCANGSPSGYTSGNNDLIATWTCSNPLGATSNQCNKYKTAPNPENGVCGSGSYGNCDAGSRNLMGLSSNGLYAQWSCGSDQNGTATRQPSFESGVCSVRAPQCGSHNGSSLTGTPTSLCNHGSASTPSLSGTNWSWNCTVNNSFGSNFTESCGAFKKVNGSCGSADGITTTSNPSSGSLCSNGSPNRTNILGNCNSQGVCSWSCSGVNGGSADSCSVTRQAQCNNGSFYSCSVGSSYNSNTGNATAAYWSCRIGTNNNTLSPRCSKTKWSASSSGSCGSANGGNYTSGEFNNLSNAAKCSSTSKSISISGSGTKSWTCYGSDLTSQRKAGSNQSCSANIITPPSCNNNTFRGCSVGSASWYTSSTGSSTATWNCSNDGRTTSCSKYKNYSGGSCGYADGSTSTLSSTPSGSAACSNGSRTSPSFSSTRDPQATWSCSKGNTHTTRGGTRSCSGGEPAPQNFEWKVVGSEGECVFGNCSSCSSMVGNSCSNENQYKTCSSGYSYCSQIYCGVQCVPE